MQMPMIPSSRPTDAGRCPPERPSDAPPRARALRARRIAAQPNATPSGIANPEWISLYDCEYRVSQIATGIVATESTPKITAQTAFERPTAVAPYCFL